MLIAHTKRSGSGALALLLVVSLTACSTTKQVALPSPAQSELNVHVRSTRSLVTLRDGRQLEVEGLQVGLDSARGELRRERTLGTGDARPGAWSEPAGGVTALTLSSREIARVELRSGRGKGGLIGTLSGLVLGGGAGAGIGYAAYDNPCPAGYAPASGSSKCVSGDSREQGLSAFFGGPIGGVVLGLVGLVIGVQGVERTYDFADAPTDAALLVEPAPAR